MKTLVKSVVTLTVISFASITLANPKCNHQSNFDMRANTNPEIKVTKSTAAKSVKGQTKSMGHIR